MVKIISFLLESLDFLLVRLADRLLGAKEKAGGYQEKI
jgi:hypothetical protein